MEQEDWEFLVGQLLTSVVWCSESKGEIRSRHLLPPIVKSRFWGKAEGVDQLVSRVSGCNFQGWSLELSGLEVASGGGLEEEGCR